MLVTGVRTFRDDKRGAERGRNVAFVVEVDGVHVVHLGDIAHTLTEEKLGEIGSVDIVCVPIGEHLSPTKAAELVAQLDPKIVVPMPVCDDEAACEPLLARFLHEMGTTASEPQPRLTITPGGLPGGDHHGAPGVAREGLAVRRRAGAARFAAYVRPRRAGRRPGGPPATTARARSAPAQYGIWACVGTSQATRSARSPGTERAPVGEAERRRGVDRRGDERLGRRRAAASGPRRS